MPTSTRNRAQNISVYLDTYPIFKITKPETIKIKKQNTTTSIHDKLILCWSTSRISYPIIKKSKNYVIKRLSRTTITTSLRATIMLVTNWENTIYNPKQRSMKNQILVRLQTRSNLCENVKWDIELNKLVRHNILLRRTTWVCVCLSE